MVDVRIQGEGEGRLRGGERGRWGVRNQSVAMVGRSNIEIAFKTRHIFRFYYRSAYKQVWPNVNNIINERFIARLNVEEQATAKI